MGKPIQIAVDFDAHSTQICSHNALSPRTLSRGEFGRSVCRVLPLVDRYGAKATSFVLGHI